MNFTEIIFTFDFRSISVIGILLIYLLYRFSVRNHNYWKEKGVPHAKPYPFLGSIADLFGKRIEDVEVERRKKFGSVHGFYEGNRPYITIGDPELLRNILVKDFQYFTDTREFHTGDRISDKMLFLLQGEDWKRVRTIISPTFSTGKIKRVMSIFQDCAKTAINNFKNDSAKGDPIDVQRIFGAFSMDVIASSAFSTKIDSHNDPENDFVKKAKNAFNQDIDWKTIIFLIEPKLLGLLKIKTFDSSSMEFFQKVTLEIIEERKRTGQTRNDFLQLLIDTVTKVPKDEISEEKYDDIVSNYGEDSTNHSVFKSTSYKNLSMDELVAQCVVFFLAGYTTTATTLGALTYLLALNQECQSKLYEELKDVLSLTDGNLTYEAIQKMKYLDNCISEALRLYPPLIAFQRTAAADYKLGDTGIVIPKGMVIQIPVYAIHRDPKLFTDPETFNPDRFSLEEREKQVPYSFLPFSTGPRNCVGMRFALVELKVCLVYVFSLFHVQRCSETQVPLKFEKGQAILQPQSVTLKVTPRKECPLNI